jgi:hypothetical protein
MTQSRHLRAIALLPLVVALLVMAIVAWQRDREQEVVSVVPQASPLPVPTAETFSPLPPLGLAAALFWVVLGGLLALGITFLILRRHKSTQ